VLPAHPPVRWICRLAGFATLAVLACVAAARADQTYKVRGTDTFNVGSTGKSVISYDGSEALRRRRSGTATLYAAIAHYTRDDQGASSKAHATFDARVTSSGEQHDIEDDDPDYLTVLKQPFAVQLDAATLHDLAHLHADVPFDFPSPMTGSTLHGSLHRIGEAVVSGSRALGVSFDAGGLMRGSLPDRQDMRLIGRIRMRGLAYYRAQDALLVLLDATLTISGNLSLPASSDPVTIVYRRTIRAVAPAQHGNAR
jgi:hypothetical protein